MSDGTTDDAADDDAKDEAEAREAAALAQALERGSGDEDLPEDALKVAALLRYRADGGVLDPARSEAVLADILAASERAAARSPRRAPAPWWRWALAALGFSAAVAALVLVVLPRTPPSPTEVPAPGPAVLTAELARLGGEPADDDAMRAYRGEVFSALTERYGE